MPAGGSLGLARLIDQYGDGLYPDLLRYFQIDLESVVEGRGPAPSLVLAAVQALPDTSLTAALSAGGREFYGWGVDRHLMANHYDQTSLLIRASGNWSKKNPAPRFPEYPRPKTRPKKKASLKDVFKRLTGGR